MNRLFSLFALLTVPALLLAPGALASNNDAATAPGGWTPYESGTMFSYAGGRTAIPDTCGCLDLMLVIDDTGSMGGAIANVQAGMLDIIALAEETCDEVRIGLVTFKDEVEVDVPLTSNTADVVNAVNALTAIGGDFEPEASDEALGELFTSSTCLASGDFDPASWREGCCKVAILVTDANPGGCDDAYVDGEDNVNAHNRALEALGLDVHIGALFVPTFGDPNGTITPVMIDYAVTTDGVFGQTAQDGSGTADAIQQVILNCVGTSATELCCLPDGSCVRVLEGECLDLNGTVVDDCEDCFTTPVEESTWGHIKSIFDTNR